jgi:hypothetical protein
MARGRFISNDVINDKEINDLSSDTCRLAYVFLITIADREGRVAGDPAYLKSLLFPRRYDIKPDDIQEFILEWVEAGFVIWYECSNGEKALRLVNFEKHQKGLRKDREAESKYDDPSYCKILAGDLLKNGKDLKEKNNKNNNMNVNINSKSGVESSKMPDKVGSMPLQEKRSNLLEKFEELTKIQQPAEMLDPKGFMVWEKEIAKWESMEVTIEDIQEAVEKADDLKSNLSWPGSITKYMASAIARRKRGVSDSHAKDNAQEFDEAKFIEEILNG